jgi:hypothetical protein
VDLVGQVGEADVTRRVVTGEALDVGHDDGGVAGRQLITDQDVLRVKQLLLAGLNASTEPVATP